MDRLQRIPLLICIEGGDFRDHLPHSDSLSLDSITPSREVSRLKKWGSMPGKTSSPVPRMRKAIDVIQFFIKGRNSLHGRGYRIHPSL